MKDWLWVLTCYFRGRLLKDERFRPQKRNDGSCFVFPSIPGETLSRRRRLMRWWGHRPVTLAEFIAEGNKDW